MVWWLLPVDAWAAFALGAVVAPPDAVAATAIARRVGMPRRMVTILQGESLVNDATALVSLRTAIAAGAAGAGTLSAVEISWDFVTTAVGGVVVGIAVAFVTGKVRYHVRDEITDTAISLITPFLAYLVAEEFHWSGVLAVVVAGLILGHKRHLVQTASSRIFERTNWRTIEFMLENTVFLLIGLQVRQIVMEAADHSALSTAEIVQACVLVTLTVIVVRPVWVFPATYLPRLIPSIRANDPFPRWTGPGRHLLGGDARRGHPGRCVRAARGHSRARGADPDRARRRRRDPARPGRDPALGDAPARPGRARPGRGRACRPPASSSARVLPGSPGSRN